LSLAFQNGILTTVGQKTDTKIPETITAISTLPAKVMPKGASPLTKPPAFELYEIDDSSGTTVLKKSRQFFKEASDKGYPDLLNRSGVNPDRRFDMSIKTLCIPAFILLLVCFLFSGSGFPEPPRAKILFVGASPVEINLDGKTEYRPQVNYIKEINDIEDKIRLAGRSGKLKFIPALAASPEELLNNLSRENPSAVHFSVHGGVGGIYLEDHSGQPSRPLTQDELIGIFTAYNNRRNIKVVVFNACQTSEIAKAIAEVVGCAIGMKAPIGPMASEVFAQGLYCALSQPDISVQEAFDRAVADLKALHTGENESPTLEYRSGVNPREVCLVTANDVEKGRAEIDIMPYPGDSGRMSPEITQQQGIVGQKTATEVIPAVSVKNDYDGTGGRIPHATGDLRLTYSYERLGKKIVIKPDMPYLSLLSQGGPIRGLQYWWSPFQWQFPNLSVKINNNTKHTLFLTEVIVNVKDSKVNIDPVLIVKENFYNVGNFDIINEGWGKVINPKIEFMVRDVSLYEKTFPAFAPDHLVQLKTFSDRARITVLGRVPPELRNNRLVCVFGKIYYSTENNRKHTIKFKTRVSLVRPGPARPAPPNYIYDLFLKSGEFGYTKRLPISQKIGPGEVDHFLVRVATDKSSQFDLAFSFRATSGAELSGSAVLLDIFVPRSQIQRIKKDASSGKRSLLTPPEPYPANPLIRQN
jgi:hypothetical protein